MVSEEMPRLNAQTALYSRVMDAAGDRPVTFRTLDLGGDKGAALSRGRTGRQSRPGLAGRAHGARTGLRSCAYNFGP